MITKYTPADFKDIYEIINDGASAYKGIIPADRWHEPYMPEHELKNQIAQGVEFWCYQENGNISGVMGIQYRGEVTLIRHAYVRSSERKKGIGSQLLTHLRSISKTPVLIGTWSAWAIKFYQKHGFCLVSESEKELLLRKYWTIPDRQIETSVVLADRKWENSDLYK